MTKKDIARENIGLFGLLCILHSPRQSAIGKVHKLLLKFDKQLDLCNGYGFVDSAHTYALNINRIPTKFMNMLKRST